MFLQETEHLEVRKTRKVERPTLLSTHSWALPVSARQFKICIHVPQQAMNMQPVQTQHTAVVHLSPLPIF